MTTTYTAAVYKLDRLLAVETFTSYNAVMAFSSTMTYKGYTTFVEDKEGHNMSNHSIHHHRANKRAILMDLGIWKRMTQAEREEFDTIEVRHSKDGKEVIDETATKREIDRLQIKHRKTYF